MSFELKLQRRRAKERAGRKANVRRLMSRKRGRRHRQDISKYGMRVRYVYKGLNPLSETYGAFGPLLLFDVQKDFAPGGSLSINPNAALDASRVHAMLKDSGLVQVW